MDCPIEEEQLLSEDTDVEEERLLPEDTVAKDGSVTRCYFYPDGKGGNVKIRRKLASPKDPSKRPSIVTLEDGTKAHQYSNGRIYVPKGRRKGPARGMKPTTVLKNAIRVGIKTCSLAQLQVLNDMIESFDQLMQ